jgi:RimJ/RimL family protein N-acetyltransferase
MWDKANKRNMSDESRIPHPLPSPDLAAGPLRIRPLSYADEARVQELASAAEIASTTLSFPHPYPPGAAREWIEKKLDTFAKGEEMALAIELEGAYIGSIGFFFNRRDDAGELGYWIGKPYWGRGFASLAAGAMLRFGFEELGLHRIQAQVMARNPGSAKVLEKIGLRYEGLLRGAIKKWGVYEDVKIYAALASDGPPFIAS